MKHKPKRLGTNHRGFYGTNVLFDDQGRCVLRSLDVWQMKSIWPQ